MKNRLMPASTTFIATIGQTSMSALNSTSSSEATVFSTRKRRMRDWSSEKTSSAEPTHPRASSQSMAEEATRRRCGASSPPYQCSMSRREIEIDGETCSRPVPMSSSIDSRVYQRASAISPSWRTTSIVSASAVKPSIRLDGNGHGWLPR